jgi:DNA-binding protein YbaB
VNGPAGAVLRLADLRSLPDEERLEACRQFIERASAAIGAAHAGSIQASDPSGLVTATVTGAGSVDEVRLGPAAMLADRDELEHAVRAAVTAARAELAAQVRDALTAIRVEPETISTGDAPANAGNAALLAEVRDGLAGSRYEKSSADGEVRVAVDRDGELSEVRLAPAALRQLDRHTLGELITGGIRDAQRAAGEALAEAVRAAWAQTSNSEPQGLGSNTTSSRR